MTTPSTLGRAQAWIAAAAIALTGVLAAEGAQAAPPPDPPRTYKVKADLDGRATPRKDNISTTDFLRRGQRVPIECQRYGGRAYGSRLWDLVSSRGETLWVPDRFIKTGTDGRASGIRRCTSQDRSDPGLDGDPFSLRTDPAARSAHGQAAGCGSRGLRPPPRPPRACAARISGPSPSACGEGHRRTRFASGTCRARSAP